MCSPVGGGTFQPATFRSRVPLGFVSFIWRRGMPANALCPSSLTPNACPPIMPDVQSSPSIIVTCVGVPPSPKSPFTASTDPGVLDAVVLVLADIGNADDAEERSIVAPSAGLTRTTRTSFGVSGNRTRASRTPCAIRYFHVDELVAETGW